MAAPVGALATATANSITVPAAFGSTFLGGSTAAATAAAAKAGALGLGGAAAGGMGALGALGAIAPWALGAIGLARMFSRKKVRVYHDLPRYDLQADRRSEADMAYTPMFLSGTTPLGQQQSPVAPTTSYDLYSQGNSPMLGLSGFGAVRGFGGFGGGVAGGQSAAQPISQTWSGFSQPMTNYGSVLTNPSKIRSATSWRKA